MGFQPAVCTLLRYSARNNDEGSKENEELMATVIYIYGWDVEALVNSRPLTISLPIAPITHSSIANW